MNERFRGQMQAECSEIGITLTEEQMDQFYRYYEMLVEKNKVMNLTAITEESDVVTKHFVDSLSLVLVLPELKEGKAISVIDVGTGAGFPGIPLKIAFPQCRITLLDSLNKRVKFLIETAEALGISEGLTAVHGRAEDYGKDPVYREKFDYSVSRAVANLSTLTEYCLPFVRVGGAFLSYKSGEIEEETQQAKHAIHLLGGKAAPVYSFELPGSDAKRSFVRIDKIEKMSSKYPRKAGLPSKEPLK